MSCHCLKGGHSITIIIHDLDLATFSIMLWFIISFLTSDVIRIFTVTITILLLSSLLNAPYHYPNS
jgi:hypothetical protein